MNITMPKGFRVFSEGGSGRGRKPIGPAVSIGPDGSLRPSTAILHWFDGVEYLELGWNARKKTIALLPVPGFARKPSHMPIRRYDRSRNVISGRSFLQSNQINYGTNQRYRAERDSSGIVYIDLKKPYHDGSE